MFYKFEMRVFVMCQYLPFIVSHIYPSKQVNLDQTAPKEAV